MATFSEEFDNKIEVFSVIGNHSTMCCEAKQVKEVFKEYRPLEKLPVIPKFVADFIEKYKAECKGWWCLLEDDKTKYPEVYKWFYNHNENLYIKAWLYGYTIEQPKRYYLKAKEQLAVGDYDHVEDLWLDWNKNLTPKKQDAHQFTQKELDSFYSKKYEQVEVTE